MHYTRDYTIALENLIMDKLLPAYIEHSRRKGIDPNTNEIIRELMLIMRTKREIPALLLPKKLT